MTIWKIWQRWICFKWKLILVGIDNSFPVKWNVGESKVYLMKDLTAAIWLVTNCVYVRKTICLYFRNLSVMNIYKVVLNNDFMVTGEVIYQSFSRVTKPRVNVLLYFLHATDVLNTYSVKTLIDR